MNDIFFSIIIPAYNAEEFLVGCIDSLKNQTFKDFEVIVVDDGSTDNTPTLCDTLSEKYKSLKIIAVHQTNQRQIAARMNGVDHSKGKFIMFLDADDKLAENSLEVIHKAIVKYRTDIVIYEGLRFCGDTIKPYGTHYSENTLLIKGNGYSKFKEDVISTTRFNTVWNKAFKREIITESERFKNVSYISTEEDFLMQLPWIDKASSAVYIPEDLYLYRLNTESITFQKFDQYSFKSALFIFDAVMQYARIWKIPNGEMIARRRFLWRVSSSIRQFSNKNIRLCHKEKLEYIKEISENEVFQREYPLFNGSLNSFMDKIILCLAYHKLCNLTLFAAEHDPKLHK